MRDATLAQARHFLDLVEDQAPSCADLQALFASGLLSLLFHPGAELEKVDLKKLRKLLGLVPLLEIDVDQNYSSFAGFDGEQWGNFHVCLSPSILLIKRKRYKFDLIKCPERGESSISAENLLETAKRKKCHFSSTYAAALLDQRDNLPLEWQSFSIIFPGGVYARNDKPGSTKLFVLMLEFTNEWRPVPVELKGIFSDKYRFLHRV